MSAKVEYSVPEASSLEDRIDPVHRAVGLQSQQVSADVWREKYRYNGEPDLKATAARVARGLIHNNTKWTRAAAEFITHGIFIPAGRVLAGAGTRNKVTLHNCFVTGAVHDSMTGIMKEAGHAAITLQMGGGIGTDFSTIRPVGAKLKKTGDGAKASGPIPFMQMWNAMSDTVMSAGHRRGAMMATLKDSHPDILAFIKAKHQKGVLTNFNVSVLISDAFIKAVEEDADWDLFFQTPHATDELRSFIDDKGTTQYIYKTVKARELWNLILQSTWKYSEPGVIFIDRVNDLNNLKDFETISCTNPCGEQPLQPHGACNLGAVNLARMIKNPFTEPSIDATILRDAVRVGMRVLDAVIDESKYPLQEQQAEQFEKRRTGLGITGLADALAMMGIRYGSDQAISWTDSVMSQIANYAYQESAIMASEKGQAPVWERVSRKRIVELPFVSKLSIETKGLIKRHGLRNGVLLTIAPTGTTSTVFGYCSSGCEPIFAHIGSRAVIMPGAQKPVSYETKGYSYKVYEHVNGPTEIDNLPQSMVTAKELTVEQHVVMQGVCQRWVDASVSKTVNCPKEITFEQFKAVYERAYTEGCKGCTTYTPSDVRGSVLSDATQPQSALAQVQQDTQLLQDSPYTRKGTRYKITWPSFESSIYVHIYDDQAGKPREIFVSSASAKHFDWITSTMRMISGHLRSGSDPMWIIEDLKKIQSFNDSAWEKGKHWPSLVARIMGVLEEHIKASQGTAQPAEPQPQSLKMVGTVYVDSEQKFMTPCPSCYAVAFVHQEGCGICQSCGYSNCG